jgi:hypothetical protein
MLLPIKLHKSGNNASTSRGNIAQANQFGKKKAECAPTTRYSIQSATAKPTASNVIVSEMPILME